MLPCCKQGDRDILIIDTSRRESRKPGLYDVPGAVHLCRVPAREIIPGLCKVVFPDDVVHASCLFIAFDRIGHLHSAAVIRIAVIVNEYVIRPVRVQRDVLLWCIGIPAPSDTHSAIRRRVPSGKVIPYPSFVILTELPVLILLGCVRECYPVIMPCRIKIPGLSRFRDIHYGLLIRIGDPDSRRAQFPAREIRNYTV